jgi:general secretion pathway protein K
VYSNCHPPYTRKNAPFDSLEELRMVRGLGDDDLWERIIDPSPSDPDVRPVTVWGQGLVNVNSASPQTAYALACSAAPPNTPACVDPQVALQFLQAMSMIMAFTSSLGVPLHSEPKGFSNMLRGGSPLAMALGLPQIPVVGSQLDDAVTIESKVFSIYAESTLGLGHARIHAVVDMRPQPAVPSLYLKGNQLPTPPQSRDSGLAAGASGNLLRVTAGGGTVVYWRED